jgi:hypothetical protein
MVFSHMERQTKGKINGVLSKKSNNKMICLKKSRCFQNKKSNKRKLSFWLFYLNNFFCFFFLPFLFLFVVSEEININGVCVYVCLFRCAYGAQPTVSKRVVCAHSILSFFFRMLRCARMHMYMYV